MQPVQGQRGLLDVQGPPDTWVAFNGRAFRMDGSNNFVESSTASQETPVALQDAETTGPVEVLDDSQEPEGEETHVGIMGPLDGYDEVEAEIERLEGMQTVASAWMFQLTHRYVQAVKDECLDLVELIVMAKTEMQAELEKAQFGQGVSGNLVLENMKSRLEAIDLEFTRLRDIVSKIAPEAKRAKIAAASSEL